MNRDLYDLGDFNTEQMRQILRVVKDEGGDTTSLLWRRPDAADAPALFVKEIPARQADGIIPDALAGAT